MCLQKDQHTNVCTTHTGCRVGIQHTHTRTHAVGGHPSFHTTARRRGAATDMASLCGGVGHWQACMACWPWSAAQLLSMDSTCAMPREERENEGGRGSQRVSRSDLCCHCMSMLMKKEKEGEGDTHLACSCCCPLVACLPATALCRAGVPHTHTCPFFFFSSSPPLCGIMHTVHVHACLSQCPMCSTHT